MMPNSESSAEPFTISTATLTQEGTMRRTACGRITRRSRCQNVNPTALAASICARGMESIPPRTISAMCAVAKILSAVIPAWNAENRSPNAGSAK